MPAGASIIGGLNAGTNMANLQRQRKRDEFDMQQAKVSEYNSIVGNAEKTLAKFSEQMAIQRAAARNAEDQAMIDQKWQETFKSVTAPLSRAGEKSATAGIPVDPIAQLARLEPYRKLPDLNANMVLEAQSSGAKKGAETRAKETVEREIPEVQNLISPQGKIVGVDTNAEGAQEHVATLLGQGYSVAPSRQSIKSATTTRDLTPKTLNTVQDKLLTTGDAIQRLRNIRGSMKEEFFNVWKRAGFGIDAIREMVGGELSADDVKALEEFTTFQTETFENFNLYVKSITGAAMSNQEAARIEQAMPVSGKGIKPKMSFTQFTAALQRVENMTTDTQIRYKLMQDQGMATGDLEQDKAAGVGDAAAAFMSHAEARRIYEARGEELYQDNLAETGDQGTAKAKTMLQLKREFGL